MTHMRKDFRLGGIIGISLLLNNSEVGEEITRVITEEIFGCIQNFEHQEELFIACALELIGNIGPNDKILARLNILKSLLCESKLRPL